MAIRIQVQSQRVRTMNADDLEVRTRPHATDGTSVRYVARGLREQLGSSQARGGEYHHWLRVRES